MGKTGIEPPTFYHLYRLNLYVIVKENFDFDRGSLSLITILHYWPWLQFSVTNTLYLLEYYFVRVALCLPLLVAFGSDLLTLSGTYWLLCSELYYVQCKYLLCLQCRARPVGCAIFDPLALLCVLAGRGRSLYFSEVQPLSFLTCGVVLIKF